MSCSKLFIIHSSSHLTPLSATCNSYNCTLRYIGSLLHLAFSCDVIAAMLEGKNNTLSLPWEKRSIFVQNCFIASALQHGRRESPLYLAPYRHLHVTSLPPCWRTWTKDFSLASIVSSTNMAATPLWFNSPGTNCIFLKFMKTIGECLAVTVYFRL